MSTSKSPAAGKTYYLYRLNHEGDLSAATFFRRSKKLVQGGHKGFLYDISVGSEKRTSALDFVFEKKTSTDAVVVSMSELSAIVQRQVHFLSTLDTSIFVKIENLSDFERAQDFLVFPQIHFLIQIKIKNDLFRVLSMINQYDSITTKKFSVFPQKYDKNTGSAISALEYLDLAKEFGSKIQLRNPEIPFWNTEINQDFELEPLLDVNWESKAAGYQTADIRISIIIPTYNNSRFLVNVISHLAQQNVSPVSFEVIVVDDGSDDESLEILKKFVQSHNLDLNLKYIYWSKKDQGRGVQNFFRPGQARNSAAMHSNGEFLMFLDSDMLVPNDFVTSCLQELQTNDLIQFQRYHIKQKLSLTNPKINTISLKKDCYIEEKHYWNQLFNCTDWNQLENPWKFVCTYALGLRKHDFFEVGRIQRHFISYGFEDTDLGFRFYKNNKKFKLVRTSLFHLTNYSQMQYQNSDFKRRQLLSVTAKTFFLDHLDAEIGTTLKTFLGGEKSLIEKFKNRFLDN